MNSTIFITVSIFLFFISNTTVILLKIDKPPEGINTYVKKIFEGNSEKLEKGFIFDLNSQQINRLCQRFMVERNLSFSAVTDEDQDTGNNLQIIVKPCKIFIEKKNVGIKKMIGCNFANENNVFPEVIRLWLTNDVEDKGALAFKILPEENKSGSVLEIQVKPFARIRNITPDDYNSKINDTVVAEWQKRAEKINKEYHNRVLKGGRGGSRGGGRGGGRGKGQNKEDKTSSRSSEGLDDRLSRSIGGLNISSPSNTISNPLNPRIPGTVGGGLTGMRPVVGGPNKFGPGVSKSSLSKPSTVDEEEDDDDDDDDSFDSKKFPSKPAGMPSMPSSIRGPGPSLLQRPVAPPAYRPVSARGMYQQDESDEDDF